MPCTMATDAEIVDHGQLPDLGAQVLDLGFMIPTGAVHAIRKHLVQTAWRFQVLTWFGCTLCLAAISWTVLSPRSASSATRALKSAENRRRFVISYSSVIRWNTP